MDEAACALGVHPHRVQFKTRLDLGRVLGRPAAVTSQTVATLLREIVRTGSHLSFFMYMSFALMTVSYLPGILCTLSLSLCVCVLADSFIC